ncbi:MAG: hypothetical protein L0211_04690 [Planctomycetaceae bacterium]|nr:hypothetical protein [Planctomycetaceae bacterium]
MTTRKASAPKDARKAEPQDAQADSPPPAGAWSPWLKWVASALIAFHLTAVFWGPLAFACAGSPLTDSVFSVLRPYIQGMYLNHGYSFFAPNVGSSQLLRYKIEFTDGREPVVGMIPNLSTERPRLLYHRHFMLTEALSNRFVPPQPPPEPTPPPLTATAGERNLYRFEQLAYQRALTGWKHERRQYEAMRQSFEQHLLAVHGGSKVTLTRVEHRPATPPEVQHALRRLDAPDSYLDLPETAPPEPVRPEPRP